MSDKTDWLLDMDAWGPTAQEAAEAMHAAFSALPTPHEAAESLRAALRILNEEPQP